MLQAAAKGKMLVPAMIEIVTSGRLMSSRESVEEVCHSFTTGDAYPYGGVLVLLL